MPHRMREYKQMPGWILGCALLLVVIALAALVILLSEG